VNLPGQATALDRWNRPRIAVVLADFQNDFCQPLDPGHDPCKPQRIVAQFAK
jgi:nicotinamidase-related amidase